MLERVTIPTARLGDKLDELINVIEIHPKEGSGKSEFPCPTGAVKERSDHEGNPTENNRFREVRATSPPAPEHDREGIIQIFL